MHLFVHMANENMPWYIQVKEEGLNKQDVTDLLQSKNISKDLREDITFYHKCISELKSRKLALEHEVNSLQERIDTMMA